jgi:hypothetical protein
MSYRVRIAIPEATGDDLAQLARYAGQPASHVAADLLRAAIERASRPAARAEAPPMPTPPLEGGGPWLEPRNDTRARWRSELWTAVLALHERYPDELANLDADWWRNPSRVEVLGALATWRSTIDTSGQDPREELAFHTQLMAFGAILDQTPGSGGAAFQDETALAEWFNA